MLHILALVLFALLPRTLVFADMDVEQEKRDAVKREAAQKAEAERKHEMQQNKTQAEARANAEMEKHLKGLTDAQRKAMGLPPAGRSTPK
jgi:hypothetical protein